MIAIKAKTNLQSAGQGHYPSRIGIDLGSHSIKVVVTHASKKGTSVASAHSVRIDNPEIYAREKPLAVLLPLLSESMVDRVVLSLPAEAYEYETIPTNVSPEHALELVHQSVAQLLGESLSQVEFDFWFGNHVWRRQRDLNLIWTNADLAASTARSIGQMRLQCEAIDSPVAALARLATDKSAENTLVVDLGHNSSRFVLSRHGHPEYFRNQVRISSGELVSEIATSLKISREASEHLLADWGLNQTASSSGAIHRLLSRFSDQWLRKLRFEIKRTQSHLQSREIEIHSVLLCGGGACTSGIEALVGRSIDLPVATATVPASLTWDAAIPYCPGFALAVSNTQYGDSL